MSVSECAGARQWTASLPRSQVLMRNKGSGSPLRLGGSLQVSHPLGHFLGVAQGQSPLCRWGSEGGVAQKDPAVFPCLRRVVIMLAVNTQTLGRLQSALGWSSHCRHKQSEKTWWCMGEITIYW